MAKGYKALDQAYGKKLKRQEASDRKKNKKRVKEFLAISPANKKTKWYY